MRIAALILIGVVFCSGSSYAEDYEAASASCATLAAYPGEPGHEGLPLEKIDVVTALPLCMQAASSAEAFGYDHYHLSRVYAAADQMEDSDRELKIAADVGNAFAQYMLASKLLQADPPDNVTGRYWLSQAAGLVPEAMVSLGYMEWNGIGGPKDLLAAIEHEKMAAALGNAVGAKNYGTYLAELPTTQGSGDSSDETYDDALDEVRRAEEEQRQEVERQNCQYNRAFGDAAAAWSGCN